MDKVVFERDTGGGAMLFHKSLPFVDAFVDELNDAIEKCRPGCGLSSKQRWWLSFCIMAIIISNGICWAQFERASLGKCSQAAVSWMFRHSKIPWEIVLEMSVRVVLMKFGITEGILDIDDTDKRRCKITRRIFKAHKVKDKKSGGYMNGQEIIFLFLVTPVVSIPVGFEFYMPDPALTAWRKQDEELKKKKVPKKERPAQPERSKDYPTKQQLALRLLMQFRSRYPEIKVKLIVADALYGTDGFMTEASKIYGKVQVVSQLRYNQIIRFRNKKMTVMDYFSKYPGTSQQITIRGGQKVAATVGSARLYVISHKRKLLVVALKYEGEEEYRYLIASDLSWRTEDVVHGHTFRWLIEVFFSDWKQYEGWGQLTKHPDEEGSSRSLILSLVLDHCLLFHPQQLTRLENKLPACTVGSLRDKTKVDCLLEFIRDLLSTPDPQEKLNLLTEAVENVFQLAPSKKHMVGRDLGRLEPTPSLKYKAKACASV
jgi:hypothetical protein